MGRGRAAGVRRVSRKKVPPARAKPKQVRKKSQGGTLAALKRELEDARQQQVATADILKAISRSSFDLQALLQTLTVSAAKLCRADMAAMTRQDSDGFFYHVTNYNFHPDWVDFQKSRPLRPGRESVVGRVLMEGKPVQVADVLADPEYTFLEAQKMGRFRTFMGVPLLRNGEPIGVLTIGRRAVDPFTADQIGLVSTFADQAVIAIENARLFEEVQARTNELAEALEQQTATAAVLRVISSSPGELQPVLDAIVRTARRMCNPDFTLLFRLIDGKYHVAAADGADPEFIRYLRGHPVAPETGTMVGRTALEGRTIYIEDAPNDPTYAWQEAARRGHYRTTLGVPLLRDGAVVGVIGLVSAAPRAFKRKQIELVETFAAQAVIAMENVRLFEETQARTRELTEALERQTATSDVLNVISRSSFHLQPVLDTILEVASRLCEAEFGTMFKLQDGRYHVAAATNTAASFIQHAVEHPIVPVRGSLIGRTALEAKTVHMPDCLADPEYTFLDFQAVGNYRSMLGVPLLREGEPIGVIGLMRAAVKPFTEKQIELVTTFADQAVIAIENVRLFDEVQARTRELTEALEQQTATSEVLKVISRSAFDLGHVFKTVADSAVKLTDAHRAFIYRYDGKFAHPEVMINVSPELRVYAGRHPIGPGRSSATARCVLERRTIHIPDVTEDPEYTYGAKEIDPLRTILSVPMLKGDELLGVIMVYHLEVRPFTEKQIALIEIFADQAAIAIENVRLLSELRESLQQQTATADVLKVISRSTFDLETVLQTLVESAAHLCEADQGTITRQQDGVFYRAASYGFSSEFNQAVTRLPVEVERGSATGRALAEAQIVHIPDIDADPDYTFAEGRKFGGFRTILAVPMLREGVPSGVLTLTRIAVRPFSQKQIELVSTFADQAAIAIENVRLFESVEQRTRELQKSLEDLRTAQDRLVQTEKLASLGQLTAGIAHEIKNPLNFVNNFASLSTELIDELEEGLGKAELSKATRAEIEDTMSMLRGNLDKIVQHGKRADSIVKNMLLHSRQGTGEHRPADINAIVEESLNLAYHGARAERQGFNITLEKSLDPAAGEVDLFPQEITRVLLNLISNGFYAATKRKAQESGNGYEPKLAVATRSLGDSVEITIRDNGTGIPPEVRDRIFNPFFTTKPAGEGTGLGLSLSHDIVVKQHAGSISVETEPGNFTEFTIVLPRRAAAIAERGARS